MDTDENILRDLITGALEPVLRVHKVFDEAALEACVDAYCEEVGADCIYNQRGFSGV